MVRGESPPSSVGNVGSMPGQRTGIPQAAGQLGLHSLADEIYQDFLIQDPGTILPTSQTSTEMPGYKHIDSLPVQRSQKSHHSLKGAQSARKKKKTNKH